MGEKGRIILDIDSPTHAQTHRAVTRYIQEKESNLVVPLELHQERKEKCNGCGKSTFRKQTEIYFGEKFCTDCVSKWKHGYK